MGGEGLEASSSFPSDTSIAPHGGAQSGAKTKISELAEVIAAWASLRPSDRAAIMLRVRAATDSPPAGGSS